MSREATGLAEAFTSTHRQHCLPCLIRCLVDGRYRAMGEHAPLHMPPEMIHGMQLGRRGGPEPHSHMQGLGSLTTGRGRMGRASIFKQHHTPPPPLGTAEAEQSLMGGVIPHSGAEERPGPTPDVDGTMADTLGLAPSPRPFPLWPAPALAMVEGWGFQGNRTGSENGNYATTCAF
jgi:hypothetical protein